MADFTKSAKGYSVEAETGHVTIVVDRASRTLVGAAMACPDASAAIHECVLAIKARVPVEVLAETIHAFPSTSRILNGLFAEALRDPARLTVAPPGAAVPFAVGRPPSPVAARQPPATTSPSTITRRGRACHSAPPISTGSATAAAGQHEEVGAMAGHEPAAVALARADRRVEARRPDRPPQRDRVRRPERRGPGRP